MISSSLRLFCNVLCPTEKTATAANRAITLRIAIQISQRGRDRSWAQGLVNKQTIPQMPEGIPTRAHRYKTQSGTSLLLLKASRYFRRIAITSTKINIVEILQYTNIA